MKVDLIEVVDEEGSLHYFLKDVHRTFVAEGAIWFDGCRWRCQSTIAVDKRLELSTCDFCLRRPVAWDVDVESFAVAGLNFESVGGWYACDACGTAIVTRDEQTLQKLALEKITHLPPAERYVSACSQLEMLTLFWKHFKGIQPIGKTS